MARWRNALRFHVPLIEPDGRISRIRLSEQDFMLSPTGGSLYALAAFSVRVARLRRD